MDNGFKRTTIESLFVLDSGKNYADSIIHSWYGPKSWIDGTLLIDMDNKKKYRIDRVDNPRPYIIYSNKLYIPKEYNILSGNKWQTSKYTEYELE